MKLGDLIIQYRNDNKISQREFARRAELSNSLISIIEKGINPQTGKEMSPDLETYKRIAIAMGCSLHTLFEKLGDDASVQLISMRGNSEPDNDENPFWHETESAPRTIEAKIVSFGMDQLPQEQREQILNVVRAMCANHPELFKERN